MTKAIVVVLCIISIFSFIYQIAEEKLHLFKVQKAMALCGISCEITKYQQGIHFNRYILNLNSELSYLEFHKLSKPLCKYSKMDCVAYKNENEYIIEVNRSRRKLNSLDKLCSQANYYNIFDFKGSKLLINIFNHIMLINVQKDFFINSLRNYTTSCVLREDMSISDIVYLIENRKHKEFRDNKYIENTKLNNVFVVIDREQDEEVSFILKYGKEVGVFAILIANQKMINSYGLNVDYVFFHGHPLEIYDITKISPIIPVHFSDCESDIYICNRTFGTRACII